MTLIDLGQDLDTSIVNIRSVYGKQQATTKQHLKLNL